MPAVIMPKMGDAMEEGTLLRWLKHEGDAVTVGEAIAEIETDKATLELNADDAGVLGQITAEEGETVPIGQRIAMILGEGESPDGANGATEAAAPARAAARAAAPAAPPAAPPPAPPAGRAAVAEERRAPERPAPGAEGRVKASPLARRIAEEHDVDLARIAGSGPGGRVVREDVEAFLKRGQPAAAPAGVAGAAAAPVAAPAPAATRMVPVSRMRAAIGRRMTESKTSVPHIYISAEVDMTEALKWRKQLNEAAAAEGYKVTVNDLVIKAAAQALTKFPNLNASFMGDQIALHGDVHVSIAVALPDGLIAPVVRNADQKSIGRIAREAADLVARTREGKIHPDEFSGGTFTVSNLGPYNVETFISIITPPQAASLAVGSSSQKAVVVDGAVAIRDRMNVTLSADHRVTDGAESAQYVNEVRRLLEHPLSLLM